MLEIAPEIFESPEPGVRPPATAVIARCLRCAVDLTRLPEAARYCPRCGLDTQASPPATLVAHVTEGHHGLTDLLDGWEHLFHLFRFARPRDLSLPFPTCQSTSLMVKGYGAALYRLGRRYEIGNGSTVNPQEAIRCYAKSARLGNVWALARMANHLIDRDSDDPNRPGSSLVPPDSDPVNH